MAVTGWFHAGFMVVTWWLQGGNVAVTRFEGNSWFMVVVQLMVVLMLGDGD